MEAINFRFRTPHFAITSRLNILYQNIMKQYTRVEQMLVAPRLSLFCLTGRPLSQLLWVQAANGLYIHFFSEIVLDMHLQPPVIPTKGWPSAMTD